jgi:hypothetical protein
VDIARSEAVEADMERLIERHSRRKAPDEESKPWNELVRRYNERRREVNRLARCDYFSRLVGSLGARAEEYDQRAALLEDRGEGIR